MPRKRLEEIFLGNQKQREHAAISTSRLASMPLTLTLDGLELGALDVRIADQPSPKPSREAAIRRLLAEALVRK